MPGIPERLARQAAAFVQGLRRLDLAKPPGVAETIDWARALAALGRRSSTPTSSKQTLGSVLKYHEDFERGPRRGSARARRGGAKCRCSRRRLTRGFVRHVVTFGRVLREAGLEVGPGRISTR